MDQQLTQQKEMIVPVINNCARCGGNHHKVYFREFYRPHNEWTHWGLCPKTNEPIMLKELSVMEK